MKRAARNWNALKEDGELACTIALLSEATLPPPDLGLHVVTRSRTVGRDDVTYGGKKIRRWATAVAPPPREAGRAQTSLGRIADRS
jgi:hypothetical protein